MKAFKTILFTLCIHFILGMGNTVAQAPDVDWQKSYGGSGTDVSHRIQKTADGGYIVAGSSGSNDGDVTGNHGNDDYWIVKLNATGNIQWQKSLGGTGNDRARSIQQTADNGYIVAGSSSSNNGDVSGNHGNLDYWIVKLNDIGDITWQKSLGGSGIDIARSIEQTTDGGYIVAGNSDSTDGDVTGNHNGNDYWVVKLNPIGDIEWQKSYGGTSSDVAYTIHQTADGGYIVAGNSSSNDGDVSGNNGDWDYWVVKLNNVGNLHWQKSLGGSQIEVAQHIHQTVDGGYIVAGYSSSNDGDVTGNHGSLDYWIVKLNTVGDVEWQKSFGGSNNDTGQSVQQTDDGGYIVAGYTESNDGDVSGFQGGQDSWVIKLNALGNIQWQKTVGGTEDDILNSILHTEDGGYIATGFSESNDGDVTGNHGGADFWIVKLDPDPLSISEFNHGVTVYPNPVTTILNIAATEPVTSVTVFNSLGQQVRSTSPLEAAFQLDMSGLPSNIYFVVIVTEKTQETFKIVVR